MRLQLLVRLIGFAAIQFVVAFPVLAQSGPTQFVAGRHGAVGIRVSTPTILDESLVTLDEVRSALILPDESIVVVSKAVAAVVRYDAQGRQSRVVGRWGEGPFEYVSPSIVRRYKDGIVVFDSGTLKFVYYGMDGVGREEWKGMPHGLTDFHIDGDDVIAFSGSSFDYFLMRIDRADRDTSRFAKGSMLRSAIMSYEGTGNLGVRAGKAYYVYPDEPAVRIVDTKAGSESVVPVPDEDWTVLSGSLPADDFEDLNHALFDGRLLKYLSVSSVNLGVLSLADYVVAMVEDGSLAWDGKDVPKAKERVLKLFIFDDAMNLLDVVALRRSDRETLGLVPVGIHDNSLLFVNAAEGKGGAEITWQLRRLEIEDLR